MRCGDQPCGGGRCHTRRRMWLCVSHLLLERSEVCGGAWRPCRHRLAAVAAAAAAAPIAAADAADAATSGLLYSASCSKGAGGPAQNPAGSGSLAKGRGADTAGRAGAQAPAPHLPCPPRDAAIKNGARKGARQACLARPDLLLGEQHTSSWTWQSAHQCMPQPQKHAGVNGQRGDVCSGMLAAT